jgi:hypothetical protein
MPASPFATWYCENIGLGPLEYILLLVPLAGAYFYGQGKKKLAWTLILGWAAFHIALQALTLFVFDCSALLPSVSE